MRCCGDAGDVGVVAGDAGVSGVASVGDAVGAGDDGETIYQGISSNDTAVIAHINSFMNEGIGYLKGLDKTVMVNMVNTAIRYYFNKQPIMSDNQYDVLKDYIEDIYPDVVFGVGSEIESGNKVKLPYTMPSMNKKKTEKLINNWFQQYPIVNDTIDKDKGVMVSYVISAKLDGVSGMFYNQDGNPRLYTRGNGIYGQDISHLTQYLPQLRDILTRKITVRGELIIKKKVFKEKYASDYANARNFVSGLVNQTKNLEDPELISKFKDIDFVCYEVIYPEFTPYKQLSLLRQINTDKSPLKVGILNENIVPTMEMLSSILQEWRSEYMYEIDGIIITHNLLYSRFNMAEGEIKNPEHAFAFKMLLTDQIAEVFVQDVVWSASKYGYLKPRIKIEPTLLSGVTIEYATAFNAGYVKANRIGVGAKVELVRSGDVIPHINRVIEPAPIAKMPPQGTYNWTETGVDIVLKDGADGEVIVKQIASFFKQIGADGIGEKTIQRFYEQGHGTITKIIELSVADIMLVPGFKQKSAENTYNSIRKALASVKLPLLMSASGMFGRGYGEKRFEQLLAVYPDLLTSNESFQEKLNKCVAIKGFAEKTCRPVIEGIPKFMNFIEKADLTEIINTKLDVVKVKPGQKNHVMTGFRDEALVELLKANGIPVADNVTKNTAVLYVDKMDPQRRKIVMANKLNIPVVVYSSIKDAVLNTG